MFSAIGSGLVWCTDSPGYAFQVKGQDQSAVAEQLAAWLNGLLTSHVPLLERPTSKEALQTLATMIERDFDKGPAEITPMLVSTL
ncbi:hypothetical protein IQ22_03221 [Pseudomonas duriflava]|uniref:Uncharacterized protein n=1 Tax=Pseudomonas duriflava TaxID=459528 RepID=A0A562Q828_9PSED|nr:hypothetical protein IQ22_03221 [Pseudomonas duriflava]